MEVKKEPKARAPFRGEVLPEMELLLASVGWLPLLEKPAPDHIYDVDSQHAADSSLLFVWTYGLQIEDFDQSVLKDLHSMLENTEGRGFSQVKLPNLTSPHRGSWHWDRIWSKLITRPLAPQSAEPATEAAPAVVSEGVHLICYRRYGFAAEAVSKPKTAKSVSNGAVT